MSLFTDSILATEWQQGNCVWTTTNTQRTPSYKIQYLQMNLDQTITDTNDHKEYL